MAALFGGHLDAVGLLGAGKGHDEQEHGQDHQHGEGDDGLPQMAAFHEDLLQIIDQAAVQIIHGPLTEFVVDQGQRSDGGGGQGQQTAQSHQNSA